MPALFRGLLVFMAFVLAGRADDLSIFPVDFPKIEINGRPANMFLDTMVPATFLIDPLAKHLEMKDRPAWVNISGISVKISELTPVKAAGQTFQAPFLIGRLPWWARLSLHLMGKIPLDGFVGWPEVRDNILVFDSGRHTIRRVEQLPPETSGWLKLKVVPSDYLLLELPLDDGEMGTVSVDTGDRRATAIRMSEAPWKEWKAAHPHAMRTNETKVGALTLTDVVVKEMSASQVNDLLNETPAATAAWKFGMAALERLDLVVDAHNGWAYLHPKPPQDTTKAPDTDADAEWKVADNVRLSSDNFFVYSGFYNWFKNDFTNAAADYAHAIALNPRNADAYSGRGTTREVLGDFTNAVADYDKVIELKPRNSEWERVYRQALLWRLGRPPHEEAKPVVGEKETPGTAVVLDPVVVSALRPKGYKERWAKTIGRFLNGSLDEKSLLTAARKSDGQTTAPEQKALACYYIGMMRLSKGDKAGAHEWFKKCQSAGMKDDSEYYFAVEELALLDAAAPR